MHEGNAKATVKPKLPDENVQSDAALRQAADDPSGATTHIEDSMAIYAMCGRCESAIFANSAVKGLGRLRRGVVPGRRRIDLRNFQSAPERAEQALRQARATGLRGALPAAACSQRGFPEHAIRRKRL